MIFLSIDVEASGPMPGLYSLVSIGAVPVVRRGGCWFVDKQDTFYVELQPQDGAMELAEATAIHGLTSAHLEEHGSPPTEALRDFCEYFDNLKDQYSRVRPAAWPSSFDAPYVGWVAQRYLDRNPLGHSAFDIPSYAMGLLDCTDRRKLHNVMVAAGYEAPENPNEHNALADAIEQAETLTWLLNFAERRAKLAAAK